MADVRGASGVPGVLQFGGISTPTPSTPLYVNLANGDLYVLINDVVTLVGAVPGGASFIIAEQSMSNHSVARQDVADANFQLASRTFAQQTYVPSAVIGEATDILAARSLSPHPLPTMWS